MHTSFLHKICHCKINFQIVFRYLDFCSKFIKTLKVKTDWDRKVTIHWLVISFLTYKIILKNIQKLKPKIVYSGENYYSDRGIYQRNWICLWTVLLKMESVVYWNQPVFTWGYFLNFAVKIFTFLCHGKVHSKFYTSITSIYTLQIYVNIYLLMCFHTGNF